MGVFTHMYLSMKRSLQNQHNWGMDSLAHINSSAAYLLPVQQHKVFKGLKIPKLWFVDLELKGSLSLFIACKIWEKKKITFQNSAVS